MISITRQMTELERLAAVRGELLASYREAIRDAADYAVAVEAARLEDFRRQLHQLAAELGSAELPELAASREQLRRVLAAYQADAQGRIDRLRREVREAAEALRTMGVHLAEASGVQAEEMDRQIRRLSELTRCDDVARLHSELRHAVAVLTEQLRGMRAENQRIVAQMRDEIRTLQRQVEDFRHAPEAAEETRNTPPQDLAPVFGGEAEAALHSAVSARTGFTLALIHLRNWGRLARDHDPALLRKVTALVRVRLAELIGPSLVVATGRDDLLLVLCPAENRVVRKRASDFSEALAQPFLIGRLRVSVQAACAMLESRPEETVAGLRERISELEAFVTGRAVRKPPPGSEA